MESPSRTRRVLRGTAKVLLVLCITELTLDFALFARLFFLNLKTRRETRNDAVWHGDDYLRGRIAPRQKAVRVGPALASFNSLGFRGDEPKGAPFRVVCLGDSVTFGWGVSGEGDTYPAQLEKNLGNPGVEVLNAGMPRWNSCDLMDLYVTRISALRPRAVVILAGWDDIGYEFLTAAEQKREKETTGDLFWKAAGESSSLAHVAEGVRRRIESLAASRAVLQERQTGPNAIRWERLAEYERILTALVGLARRDGAQPVLVTLPHFLEPSLGEEEKRKMVPHLLAWPDVSSKGWWRVVTHTNEAIRKISWTLSVPLADCERSVPPEHFTDVAHLDEKGNRQLAACVARTLDPLVSPGETPQEVRP